MKDDKRPKQCARALNPAGCSKYIDPFMEYKVLYKYQLAGISKQDYFRFGVDDAFKSSISNRFLTCSSAVNITKVSQGMQASTTSLTIDFEIGKIETEDEAVSIGMALDKHSILVKDFFLTFNDDKFEIMQKSIRPVDGVMAKIVQPSQNINGRTVNGGGISGGLVFLMLLLVLGLLAGGFLVFQRYQKIQTRNEVRSILAEYVPLPDGSQVNLDIDENENLI